jgi:type IV secretory pathway VirJ component
MVPIASTAGRSRRRISLGFPPYRPEYGLGGSTLALMMSGDGGWAAIDKDIARTLSDSGVPVVGLDSKSYLGTRRTPEEVAADIDQVLRYYLKAWNRQRIILVGYSRGAVIAPFIVNRLPADLRKRISLVAMLGLGLHAGFHVSLRDMLATTTNPKDQPVEPEIRELASAGVAMLCIYGIEEHESFCRDGPEGLMQRIAKDGAHHFDGDHAAPPPTFSRTFPSALGHAALHDG